MAKLYVAYGSNLNREQMRYRCPTAKFVGTGIIEGYELQFKGALHGACATIAPKEGAAVPVGIWTIQRADEKRLDLYEGYHEHGHSFYDKEQIAVKWTWQYHHRHGLHHGSQNGFRKSQRGVLRHCPTEGMRIADWTRLC